MFLNLDRELSQLVPLRSIATEDGQRSARPRDVANIQALSANPCAAHWDNPRSGHELRNHTLSLTAFHDAKVIFRAHLAALEDHFQTISG